MQPEAIFVKPSRNNIDDVDTLTMERARSNQENGVETVIIPDTNVLINMENVSGMPLSVDSLKKKGVYNILSFMDKCTRNSIGLWWCPYFAISEMPGFSAVQSIKKIELFEKRGFMQWSYEENNIGNINSLQKDNSFPCMEIEEKEVMALSFSSLLLMIIIERDFKNSSPYEKMLCYINMIEHKVGLISAREYVIAAIIFSCESKTDKEFNALRKDVKNNFSSWGKMKNGTDIEKIVKCASNGARDIHMLDACNILDSNKSEPRDVWLATADFKMVNFMNNFHHVAGYGGAGQTIAMTDFSKGNQFMGDALAEYKLRTTIRHGVIKYPPDRNYLVRIAYEMIDLVVGGINKEKIPQYGIIKIPSLLRV
ncbi:hypothetical protein ACIPT2_08415 [Pectobacterium brasiliense]|uniref:hypothetical protein n=1 Tax=Pectobacterium brasiliense TaxID=180957 RepID=UPI0037FD0D01